LAILSCRPSTLKDYYGFGFIVVFVCIAWLAQELNIRWGILLGLPALFIGVYPAMKNFGSEKLTSGAIVAFDRADCPEGWDQYVRANGRVLVGAGKGTFDETNRPLSEERFGVLAGRKIINLQSRRCPTHNHGVQDLTHPDYLRGQSGNGGTERVGQSANNNPNAQIFFSEMTGDSRLHNVMPPFSVVTFCVKK